eukprot:scaffold66332_cov46-Prasinocladus_malaysianus.AAC.1
MGTHLSLPTSKARAVRMLLLLIEGHLVVKRRSELAAMGMLKPSALHCPVMSNIRRQSWTTSGAVDASRFHPKQNLLNSPHS